MDLMERYIFAVTRRLPEKNREDIEKELRSIIEDMLDQNPEAEPREAKVIKVLQELGDPDILADNYRDSKRYLIGPHLFSKYLMVLKIVLIAVFGGVSIAAIISIITQDQTIGVALGTYIGSAFSGMMQAFAWVTLSFALVERSGKTVSSPSDWEVSDLPHIPVKQALIPRSEPIASIIFSTIFLIIFWSALHLFGVGYFTEQTGLVIVPIFNLELIDSFRWLIIGGFIITIVKEVLKLIAGRWSLKLSFAVAALSLVSLGLAVAVLTNPNVWNPSFVADLTSQMDIGLDIARVWGMITNNIVFVMIIAFLLEAATALYKGYKYSNL